MHAQLYCYIIKQLEIAEKLLKSATTENTTKAIEILKAIQNEMIDWY